MARYIALLRGINVGGHRVKMDRLRTLFADMGFEEVSTFIASGNVTFDSDATDVAVVRTTIESHLERELGYAVPTLLRTPDEIHAVAEYAAEMSAPSTYVAFLTEAPDEALRSQLSELDSDNDEFRFKDREVFWLIQGRMSESPLFGRLFDRATRGHVMTMRNSTTVEKLSRKLSTP